MKTTIKELTLENFQKYGTFAPLTPPTTKPLAGENTPIRFWPDCGGVLDLGPNASNQLAIGICQVDYRDFKVDVSEFHSSCGEGNIPLDGDIYIHVAVPTGNGEIDAKDIEIFKIKQGTVVIMKPGVWHHAPFSTKPGETVNTIIMLPQRTYFNDCEVVEIEDELTF